MPASSLYQCQDLKGKVVVITGASAGFGEVSPAKHTWRLVIAVVRSVCLRTTILASLWRNFVFRNSTVSFNIIFTEQAQKHAHLHVPTL
jgi:hypothetical protein